jgi:hypothetical protein
MPILRLALLLITLSMMIACSGKKAPATTPKKTTEKAEPQAQAKTPTEPQEDTKEPESDEPLTEEDAKTILIGIWRVDVKSLGKKPNVDPLANDESAAIAVQYRTLSMVAFEFSPDGKYAQYLGQQVLRGTYTIEKATGNVLRVTTKVNGKTSKVRITVTEENLVLKESGQPTLRLERGVPKVPGTTP